MPYIILTNTDECFGIDAGIAVCKTKDKAKDLFNQSFVQAIQQTNGKQRDCKISDSKYCITLENGDKFFGNINVIDIADRPKMQEGQAPETIKRITTLLMQNREAGFCLDRILLSEISFNEQEELKYLEKLKEAISDSMKTTDDTIALIKEKMNHFWLSIDEDDGELDYALFHNKNEAKSYLTCRFIQSAKSIFNDNEEKIQKAKNKFLADCKMKFELQGDYYNAYGKIMEITMEE